MSSASSSRRRRERSRSERPGTVCDSSAKKWGRSDSAQMIAPAQRLPISSTA